MNASLRIQFLVPMLIAVLATAMGVTICSKWFSDKYSRNVTLDRLDSTGRLCVNASYPLTTSVLTSIQELSNLRLAIVQTNTETNGSTKREIQFESTSSLFPKEASAHEFESVCEQARKLPRLRFLKQIETSPGIQWNATAYRLHAAEPSQSRDRFVVLMELVDHANGTSMQAFVLPLITGLFSSIAIAVVATWVASRIGHRIERLRSHVQTIADGSFETIVPEGPRDDIHLLYQSVNTMSLQLQRTTTQIAQNERSRLVNLIASGLAHELRNHLTGARLAIQTCETDPKTSEALSIAHKQMQLAEESIQRLLALRVDSTSAMSPPMSPAQIIQAVQELTQPMAMHRRVAFDIPSIAPRSSNENTNKDAPEHESSLEDGMVNDGNAVVGALINLVLNAFEAAGTGGRVELLFDLEEEMGEVFAEWRVRDNGPGPSEQIADEMFEPFATTKPEGVGLGLAMCQRIAQRHQGDIHWTREGQWTEFVFRIKAVQSA